MLSEIILSQNNELTISKWELIYKNIEMDGNLVWLVSWGINYTISVCFISNLENEKHNHIIDKIPFSSV